MGRRLEAKPVALGPMPLAKDIGRRPLPGFGSLQIDQVVPDAQQPRAEFAPEALTYVPPTRVSQDLTERQRNILAILGDGAQWRVKDILSRLDNPPAKRTLQDDLSLLRLLGLIETSGRGAGSRWRLKQSPE